MNATLSTSQRCLDAEIETGVMPLALQLLLKQTSRIVHELRSVIPLIVLFFL